LSYIFFLIKIFICFLFRCFCCWCCNEHPWQSCSDHHPTTSLFVWEKRKRNVWKIFFISYFILLIHRGPPSKEVYPIIEQASSIIKVCVDSLDKPATDSQMKQACLYTLGVVIARCYLPFYETFEIQFFFLICFFSL
jgi:hypothetical protein